MVNLGFGGSCHAEPAMADYLAARDDWDIVTCELGINLVENRLPLAEVAERFAYLARTLTKSQPNNRPNRKAVLITAFPCKNDLYASDDPSRIRLNALRDAVRAAHAACEPDTTTLLEGFDLLPEWIGLTTDLVHPSDYGMSVIGNHLAAKLQPVLPIPASAGTPS